MLCGWSKRWRCGLVRVKGVDEGKRREGPAGTVKKSQASNSAGPVLLAQGGRKLVGDGGTQ